MPYIHRLIEQAKLLDPTLGEELDKEVKRLGLIDMAELCEEKTVLEGGLLQVANLVSAQLFPAGEDEDADKEHRIKNAVFYVAEICRRVLHLKELLEAQQNQPNDRSSWNREDY